MGYVFTNGDVGLPTDPDTVASFVTNKGTAGRINCEGVGFHIVITGRMCRGTAEAPAPVEAGGQLFSVNAMGWNEGGYDEGHGAARVGLTFCVTEEWTPDAQGAHLIIFTTPLGSNVRQDRFKLDHDGSGLVLPDGLDTTVPGNWRRIWDADGNLYSGGVKVTPQGAPAP